MSRSRSSGLLSLIYVHNPFYLISACLFVYGLKLLFRNGDSSVLFERGAVAYMEPWGLMSSFAGVTLLMAVTAILVVRCGKVWEDARSLVLIVLLMLLAISVSFDEIITVLSDRDNSLRHLLLMFGVGIVFALSVAEGLIRGLGLRLPFAYRVPLFAFLILFFAWPLLLLPELTGFEKATTRWFIAAFPLASAGITVMLIPAVRHGSAAVANNGTPWSWPLFPWTPFVFIGIAVLFRSYSLTMSFDPVAANGHYWDTTFSIYQLVPFILAIMVVLLEIGIVEQKPALQRGILLSAPLLLVLSYPWLVPWSQLPSYAAFTYAFTNRFASPVFLTIVSLGIMFGYAWWKRVRHAEAGCMGMMALACLINPRAFGTDIWSLVPVRLHWWPVVALGIIQVIAGMRVRQSARLFVGLLLISFASYIAAGDVPAVRNWRIILLAHSVYAAIPLTGRLFNDNFAKAMRELEAPALFGLTALGTILLPRTESAMALAALYAGGMTLLAVVLSLVLCNRHFLFVAAAQTAFGILAAMIWGLWLFIHARLPDGTKQVVLAVVSFAVAVFISVLKSGLSRRIRMLLITRRRATGQTLQPHP